MKQRMSFLNVSNVSREKCELDYRWNCQGHDIFQSFCFYRRYDWNKMYR